MGVLFFLGMLGDGIYGSSVKGTGMGSWLASRLERKSESFREAVWAFLSKSSPAERHAWFDFGARWLCFVVGNRRCAMEAAFCYRIEIRIIKHVRRDPLLVIHISCVKYFDTTSR